MAQSFFSPAWYRVAQLRPRLRTHAQLHRQRFRGQTWYVLQDRQLDRFYRLSPAAHRMVCMLDGRRSVRDIWEAVCSRLKDDERQPTQDETIRLLAQLHHADLLHGETPPDMAEFSQRAERQQRRELLMRVRNPLGLRIPLIDPERFLDLTLPLLRPVFSRVGLAVWLAMVTLGGVLAVLHWDALASDVGSRAWTAQSLVLLVATYAVVKAIHELGHGYALKVWGGEVHEMGIMLLVLVPIPYVEASAASAFGHKWRRALVSAAGIMVEALLASLALVFWVLAEPGLARAVALNVALIGGISTLLFNGNPLLRFDGYYVLSDLIEIPNLASRANRYFFSVIRRYAFRVEEDGTVLTAPGEAGWFLFYALASFVYRFFIMLSIALFIASKFFVIGILLALMVIWSTCVWPVCKGVHYLAASPALRRQRRHAVGVTLAAAAVVGGLLFGLPLPHYTLSQGVVRLPEHASVAARTNGFIAEVTQPSGSQVVAGTPLITMRDPELAAWLAVRTQELAELSLRRFAVEMTDQVQARLLSEQIRHTEADIALGRRRQAALTVRAEKSGLFIVPEATDLPGRYATEGQVLGYIVAPGDPVVRVVIGQDDVDLVRRHTRAVSVRRVETADRVVAARIIREVPLARAELPSLALGTAGGGDIVLDPQSPERALESLFHFEVALADTAERTFIGSRVYVRFEHGTRPLALRLARTLRQLFLSQFGV